MVRIGRRAKGANSEEHNAPLNDTKQLNECTAATATCIPVLRIRAVVGNIGVGVGIGMNIGIITGIGSGTK